MEEQASGTCWMPRLVNFFVLKDQPPPGGNANGRFWRAVTKTTRCPRAKSRRLPRNHGCREGVVRGAPGLPLYAPAGSPRATTPSCGPFRAANGWTGWRGAPSSSPIAHSTAGTAGCRPTPTAGTPPCRSTTAGTCFSLRGGVLAGLQGERAIPARRAAGAELVPTAACM